MDLYNRLSVNGVIDPIDLIHGDDGMFTWEYQRSPALPELQGNVTADYLFYAGPGPTLSLLTESFD